MITAQALVMQDRAAKAQGALLKLSGLGEEDLCLSVGSRCLSVLSHMRQQYDRFFKTATAWASLVP